MRKILTAIVILICLAGCNNEIKEIDSNRVSMFNHVLPLESGITFKNELNENNELNFFTYSYLYMGGGVAAGDINNDGLIDLYFTGNQVENKLYLNKGNLKFEDVTISSGVQGDHRWYTGVTMADVNADGFLDIYCSVSGKFEPRENQLFINNQDGTFTERAKEFGLADDGYSIQSTFFDYDKDGDLDLYVGNYPPTKFNSPAFVYVQRMRNLKEIDSDHLYKNNNGKFIDVSKESGILNFGLTLSATIGDLNNDSWPDIYVSNDFASPDYFFLNQQDGTFKEVVNQATSHTAFYGMGADISDFNNDGHLDIFQVDMDAQNNRRQKANMASMNPKLFKDIENAGFQTQYMQNCFQINSGIYREGVPHFSNISRLTGMSSTDWSWGPLFADFDNDGLKDLYISNGTRREISNNDFFIMLEDKQLNRDSMLVWSQKIPSEKIDNFMFQNKGNYNFKRVNKNWGIEFEGFSNGVVYSDLDNDGDLEVVTNNIDDYAALFNNNSSKEKNFINVSFEGPKSNSFGLGNRVFVTADGKTQMQELTLTRGFQSSVAPRLHFGLAKTNNISSIKVIWTDGRVQELKDVKSNQFLVFNYEESVVESKQEEKNNLIFSKEEAGVFPVHRHQENEYDDFKRQVLLPHKMSAFGPALAVGDLNGDSLEDYYVGGSFGNAGGLFYQTKDGFEKVLDDVFKTDRIYEDVGALIFDSDNDGDNDLYVVSGGYEFLENSEQLQDRLYINDGSGRLSKAPIHTLPKMLVSGSKVYNADFDNDGEQDLLVLGRQIPGKYPRPATTSLLRNIGKDGNPKYRSFSDGYSKVLENIGMATSAVVTDFNKDGWIDIIMVGEWMPIKVLKNTGKGLVDVSEEVGLNKDTTGWWWSIKAGDFDNDGDMDYIVGNNGLNYKYKAKENETFDIYVNDFDKNNKEDIVLSYYSEGQKYPVRGRSCSSQQIPAIKNKFKNYETYSQATLVDVYSKKALDAALHYSVKSFASVYLENRNGKFKIHELPIEAQVSSINEILVQDFNNDQHLDVLLVGNLFSSEVETPRNDASHGLLLKGNGRGGFEPIKATESGFFTPEDCKNMSLITVRGVQYVLVAKNNDVIDVVKIN